jgi:hypothetical protein
MLNSTFEKTMVSLATVAVALLLIITSILIYTWVIAIYGPMQRAKERKPQMK